MPDGRRRDSTTDAMARKRRFVSAGGSNWPQQLDSGLTPTSDFVTQDQFGSALPRPRRSSGFAPATVIS
jgi:hypothetical protein